MSEFGHEFRKNLYTLARYILRLKGCCYLDIQVVVVNDEHSETISGL